MGLYFSYPSLIFFPSYFAQILEEHGPLEASDPLLVGELDNFPTEAQQKIEAAGGLKAFLLESLRFVMTEDLIGLMKHAVSLQNTVTDEATGISDCYSLTPVRTCFSDDLEPRESFYLNPTAKEFLPQFERSSLSNSNETNDIPASLEDKDSLASALPEPHNSVTGLYHTLPDPYEFGSLKSHSFGLLPEDAGSSGTPNVQEAEYPDYLLSVCDSSALTSDIFNLHREKGGGEPLEGINLKETKPPGSKAVSVQVRFLGRTLN